jgi:hypothetical protein
MLRNVLAFRFKVFGRVPGVGRICKVSVIRPKDRPHHRIPATVNLPPAARIGSEFRGAPDTNVSTGFQSGMLVRNLKHDRFNFSSCEAVLRLLWTPLRQVYSGPAVDWSVDLRE